MAGITACCPDSPLRTRALIPSVAGSAGCRRLREVPPGLSAVRHPSLDTAPCSDWLVHCASAPDLWCQVRTSLRGQVVPHRSASPPQEAACMSGSVSQGARPTAAPVTQHSSLVCVPAVAMMFPLPGTTPCLLCLHLKQQSQSSSIVLTCKSCSFIVALMLTCPSLLTDTAAKAPQSSRVVNHFIDIWRVINNGTAEYTPSARRSKA